MVGSNEESAKGYDSPWVSWYFNGDTTCAWGMDTVNTAHCTMGDILKFNDIGKECAEK